MDRVERPAHDAEAVPLAVRPGLTGEPGRDDVVGRRPGGHGARRDRSRPASCAVEQEDGHAQLCGRPLPMEIVIASIRCRITKAISPKPQAGIGSSRSARSASPKFMSGTLRG